MSGYHDQIVQAFGDAIDAAIEGDEERFEAEVKQAQRWYEEGPESETWMRHRKLLTELKERMRG